MTKSVLFVCLGNICRSPLAEAVMNKVVSDAGAASEWTIDSCGTGAYHIGDSPDDRGQAQMRKHGLTTTHKARQLCVDDFHKFDYIFGMDEDNIRNIKRVAPANGKAKISLLGDYDPKGVKIIDDPYYGGARGFEDTYEQCTRCCKAFYEQAYK